MARYSRFNFDNYTPNYESEEARIRDYLWDLYNVAPQSIYNAAFTCLVNNDKEAMADLLYKLYARIESQQNEINRLKEPEERINGLKEEIQKLKDNEAQLERENAKLRLKLKDVYKSEAGLDLRIWEMHIEEGQSLSEIARIIGKDKKTVKKHLDKMEAYNKRKKEEEEETLKELTKHLPIPQKML